ncbi:Ubiquitin-conjugating enzyme [Gracilaria domingensis]|nr:Ubiquitin-conjugating enzyme [Gracilaria domingensis]
MRILLKEFKLVNQLATILINESIMDVQERIPVFVSALRVVHAMTESPQLRSLIVHPIGGPTGRSIAELVESLSQQAAFLTTGAEQASLPMHTAVLIKQIRRCIRVINRHRLLEKTKSAMDTGTVNLDSVSAQADGKDGNKGSENVNTDSPADLKVQDDILEEDKAAYIQEMRQHQFKAVPGLFKSSTFKSKAEQYDRNGVPHPRRQRRIATEVASLLSSLPLSWSSSILLRVDEDRYDILRACIFGPEDTPYDSGAFLFDIYLPLDYPVNPPKFSLLTTGAGKVRFNPNLYSNGKVCLSLLGTWSGPSWNQSSTILQVLVSIQSLIFVSDPYFNEPGYESQIGTTRGKQSSELYNSRIRYYSAFHAIQTQIRKPPPEFEDGIATHFRLKRKYIKNRLARWFPSAAEGAKEGAEESNPSANGHCNPHVTVDPILHSLHMVLANASSSAAAQVGNHPKQNFAHFASYEPGRNYRSSTTMTSANLKSIFEDLDACASETPQDSAADL